MFCCSRSVVGPAVVQNYVIHNVQRNEYKPYYRSLIEFEDQRGPENDLNGIWISI